MPGQEDQPLYRYIWVLVDVYSLRLWSSLLGKWIDLQAVVIFLTFPHISVRKTAAEVWEAFDKVFKTLDGHYPICVETDEGTEVMYKPASRGRLLQFFKLFISF